MKPSRSLLAWGLVGLSCLSFACREDVASRPQGVAPAPESLADRLDAALAPQAKDVSEALDLARQASAAAAERWRDDPQELAAELEDLGWRLASWCGATRAAWGFAEQLLEEARDLREAGGKDERPALAATLSTLGYVAYRQGRLRPAEDYDREALDVRRQALPAGSLEIGDSHLELALVYFEQARFEDAENALDEAQAIYQRAQPPADDGIAQVFVVRAELRRVLNQYVDAERALAKARAHAAKAGMDAFIAEELENNLAGLYRDLGELAKAERTYAGVLAAVKSSPDACGRDLAEIRLNLGEIYRLQGASAEAERFLAEALALAMTHLADDDPRLAFFLNRNAALHEERGELSLAADFYRQALAVSRASLTPDHPQVALQLHDLAGVEMRLGRLPEAEELYREALRIWEEAFGRDDPESAYTLTKLAQCLIERGETAEAQRLLEEAIGFFSASPHSVLPEVEAEAFWLRARLHERAGDRSRALEDLERSLRVIEGLRLELGEDEERQVGFLARHAEAYRQLVEWRLEDEGELERAVEAMERSRARSLVGQLLRAHVRPRSAAPDGPESHARRRAAELRQRIEFLRRETDVEPAQTLSDLQRELAEVRATLRRFDEETKRDSQLWQMTAGAPPVGLRAIQADIVPADASLLMYHVGSAASHLVVVPRAPSTAEAFTLEIAAADAAALGVGPGALTREKLRRILDGDHGLLGELGTRPRERGAGSSGPVPLDVRLHSLFRTLVPARVWRRVREQALVVVVPDGALHRLPFEALVSEPAATGGPRWWISDGPHVQYAASAGVLDTLASRGRNRALEPISSRLLLSIVDPAIGPAQRARFGDLRPLPGARQEARAILKAFGAAAHDVQSLAGPHALEPAVREAVVGKPYLHFATHGVVVEQRDRLFATLLLAPTPDTDAAAADGFLELPEIYELELDGELAVLSACSTQIGPFVEGEGVFSLSRGFLIAGAQRVIASLWKVEDASTAALMSHLFEEIADGEAEGREPRYVEALRRARCAVRAREEWRDPYYWAPFILIGETPSTVARPAPCAG